MATTLSRNLKLRIDSNLTASAKYNLERIDLLGSTFLTDTTNSLNIRSQTDIVIEPESADVSGSGVGGTVSIGTPSHNVAEFAVYADVFSLSSQLALADQATGGDKELRLSYKSDINGPVDTSANRTLYMDLDGADRNLVLGGNLSLLGGNLTWNLSGTTSLSLPQTGTLSTLSGAESLTNKTIDAALNSITGITNSSISASAAIAYSKLSLSGSIQNSDISGSAAIAYSKLNLAGVLTNSDINASAAIAYSKLALTGSLVNADISSSAAIAGSKISPDFGNQTIRTLAGLEFEEGGYKTTIQAASGGQSQDLVFSLPSDYGTNGQVLSTNGSGELGWVTSSGSGTVTSVDLAVPAEFTVSGNPVTTSGTLTVTKATQVANKVYAGPTTGADAQPTFRDLVLADLPSGLLAQASTTWAPGDGTTKSFAHGLGTSAIDVSVIDNSSEIVYCDISVLDSNTIQLTSSETPGGNWTVVVQGG